jgi:hypothetical protein
VTGALLLDDAMPGMGTAARLDENGDVRLDENVIRQIRRAFADRIDQNYLESVETARSARCEALLRSTEAAAEGSDVLEEREARNLMVELGRRIADVLPYVILGKLVPDVLLGVLEREGSGPDLVASSFQGRSAGSHLSEGLLELYRSCLNRGYPPARLEREWPAVEPGVAGAVKRFVSRYTGFGPVAWEAPGFETPGYVFAAMTATFSGIDPDTLRRPAGVPPSTAAEEEGRSAHLRRALRSWAEFTEQQIWLVRGAFYRGMVPLLRPSTGVWQTPSETTTRPEDLLFAELEEIAGALPDPPELSRRRDEYLGNTSYLSRHGILPGRLQAIVEGL